MTKEQFLNWIKENGSIEDKADVQTIEKGPADNWTELFYNELKQKHWRQADVETEGVFDGI